MKPGDDGAGPRQVDAHPAMRANDDHWLAWVDEVFPGDLRRMPVPQFFGYVNGTREAVARRWIVCERRDAGLPGWGEHVPLYRLTAAGAAALASWRARFPHGEPGAGGELKRSPAAPPAAP